MQTGLELGEAAGASSSWFARKRWLLAMLLLAVPVAFVLSIVFVGDGSKETVAVPPSAFGQYARVEGLYTGRGTTSEDVGLPLVWFRVRNIGDSVITDVTVRVNFLDETGKSVRVEDFTPVHSAYDPDGTGHALKPGQVWQMPFNQYYMPKKVPWTWKEGSATAEIASLRVEAP